MSCYLNHVKFALKTQLYVCLVNAYTSFVNLGETTTTTTTTNYG